MFMLNVTTGTIVNPVAQIILAKSRKGCFTAADVCYTQEMKNMKGTGHGENGTALVEESYKMTKFIQNSRF